MAGHSKWANIRHRKAKEDAKKAKVFTKLIREISVAARMGGADPLSNPRLRAAMDDALAANMTKDTIERAIKRGAGQSEDSALEELSYEGYGPYGVAVLINCMTNNRNRTVAEVRHAFTKAGGNLGTEGSVAYLFPKKAILEFAFSPAQFDIFLEKAIEAGAEEIEESEDLQACSIILPCEQLTAVQSKLEEAGFEARSVAMHRLPTVFVPMVDAEMEDKILQLIDRLEDLEDVQNVYHNADLSEDVES